MDRKIVKHNPAFLPEKDLIDGFVVRLTEFDLITEIVRENTTESNQHVLVIGPRGSGKTTLVRRVALEIGKNVKLKGQWYPIIFGEESYMVSTPGEFWLEAIFHLGHQTKDKRWKNLHNELKEESNEERLREKALAQLLDFADSQGKRLILIVENLHQLLGEQISDKDAWVLRKAMLHEPRIMILATSISTFEEIENEGKAMFDLFKKVKLEALDDTQCKTLWESITGKPGSNKRIRPIRILTGGNPRLVTIISRFGEKLSLRNFMEDLLQLVDENTEYFKSHLDSLSVQERKVYLSLAEIWDPATAKQVSEKARLAVNSTSTILGRLEDKGAVRVVGKEGRKKDYQITERMYNIYHLMRRRGGGTSSRVKFAVKFMIILSEDEIMSIFKKESDEAIVDRERRRDFYTLCETLLEDDSCSHIKDKLLYSVPKTLIQEGDAPDSLKKKLELAEKIREKERLESVLETMNNVIEIAENENSTKKEIKTLEKKLLNTEIKEYDEYIMFGRAWMSVIDDPDTAEKLFREAISFKPDEAEGLICLAKALLQQDKHDEAKSVLESVLSIEPMDHVGNEMYGLLMGQHYEDYDEAEKALKKALEVDSECSASWSNLGLALYCKSDWEESEQAFENAIKIDPNNFKAIANLARLLAAYKPKEAKEVFQRALDTEASNSQLWHSYALYLEDEGYYDEAIEAFRNAANMDKENVCPWVYLGKLLASKRHDYTEAIKCFQTAIKKHEKCTLAMQYLGDLYTQIGKNAEADKILEKALSIDKDDVGILCSIGLNKLKQNDKQSTMSYLKKALNVTEDDSSDIKDIITFVINLASNSLAEQSLRLIEKSNAKKFFEPLIVALRMYLRPEENVKVAEEIKEVAKDVLKRIQEAKEANKQMTSRN
jgi:tetratricopeptide (TPR) repeat protein